MEGFWVRAYVRDTIKTCSDAIAEILLKVALRHKKIKSIKSNSFQF